jgi:NAD(P)-dependent dehydrogenase (short-subunit alcohol dehydrogenase family)
VTAAKTAVVTGASSGIGAAAVRRLLCDDWRVVGLSRRDPQLHDDRFSWVAADLANLDDLRSHASHIGAVDAIVHAAGLQRSAPMGKLNVDDGLDMWRVHVAAAEVLVNELSDRIRDGGRIVLVGSRTMTGNAGKSQYAATKSALLGMARSWAMELVDRAITVNVVAPGPTDTPMLSDPARRHTPPKPPPMGRFIDADEVAGLIAFLLAPHGRSITGQAISQCAGASLQ